VQGYTIDEVFEAVRYKFRGAQWTEYTQAYDEGRIRVPTITVKYYFYGGQTGGHLCARSAYFRPQARSLSPAQEAFLLGLVVEMHLHRKPLSVHEIGRWVTITGMANGTVAPTW
jgi:hypothetical protein